MARKFLTPVGLPSGASNPAAGTAGALFFNTSDELVYVHDGTSWSPVVDGLASLSGASFTGNISTTGDANVAGKLSVTASGGDEGGEMFLASPQTSTSINTGVTIDVYQNKLRFFEDGGSNRGFYLDITSGGSSVGTNLVSAGGGGSGTVTSITASSPLTGGTITTSGTIGINASSNNTANYVVQRDASGNFAANQITAVSQKFGLDAGAPSFDSYSAGVRTIYYDNISNVSAGYTVGINSGEFWHTTSDTTGSFKWYGGTTLAGTLTGTGAFTAVANVSAPQLISTVASGTAPFTVSSNTVVTNLNADLLDGYNTDTASTANTVVVRDANASITANVVTASALVKSGGTSSEFLKADGSVDTTAYTTNTGTVTSVGTSGPLTGGTITSTGTIGINSSSTNTANYVVQRDADGSFAANAITGDSFLSNGAIVTYDQLVVGFSPISNVASISIGRASIVSETQISFFSNGDWNLFDAQINVTGGVDDSEGLGEMTIHSANLTTTGNISVASGKQSAIATSQTSVTPETDTWGANKVIMTAGVEGAVTPTLRPDGTELQAGDIWVSW